MPALLPLRDLRKHIKQLLFGLLVIALGLPSYADEVISFKMSKFGITVAQFVQFNPEFKCPQDPSEILRCGSTATTYAGFETKSASASFIQGRLSHIELLVKENSEEYLAIYAFGTIEDALVSKYGQPKRTKDAVGGLQRSISVWQSNGLSIQLSHAKKEQINLVGVMIGRDDHWQRSVDLRRSKAKGDI